MNDWTEIRRRVLVEGVSQRQILRETGMTCDELAAEMVHLGFREALNLDGGGSSLMAIREPESGKFQILNHPTDGRERAVVNVLGIVANKSAVTKVPAIR